MCVCDCACARARNTTARCTGSGKGLLVTMASGLLRVSIDGVSGEIRFTDGYEQQARVLVSNVRGTNGGTTLPFPRLGCPLRSLGGGSVGARFFPPYVFFSVHHVISCGISCGRRPYTIGVAHMIDRVLFVRSRPISATAIDRLNAPIVSRIIGGAASAGASTFLAVGLCALWLRAVTANLRQAP